MALPSPPAVSAPIVSVAMVIVDVCGQLSADKVPAPGKQGSECSFVVMVLAGARKLHSDPCFPDWRGGFTLRFPAMTSSIRLNMRVAIAALVAAGTAHAQIGTPQDRAVFATRVDSLVKAYMAESHAPGVSVAVIRGRDTIVFAGFGLADIEAHRPATAATIYEIGSNTKQFTSAAIMRLAEQHKLSIDDELSKYLPEIPLHGNRVTLRELLSHTSGIKSYTEVKAWQSHWAEDLTPDSIMGFVAKDTFDFAPGTRYKYDNSGYVLLGMVIEKVSGESYANYLESQFFKPLGLTHTSYCPSHTTDPEFAEGYSKKDDSVARHVYLSLTQPFAAGSLCSNVGDFVQWQRDLAAGKVVSPASFAQMSTDASLLNGQKIHYGFGLVPGETLGHKNFSHTGGIPGFATVGYYFPDDMLNIVVFSNYDGASPVFVAANIARMAYGGAPEAPRPRPQRPGR
jgi:D-alanyl-D-alanine carboxypeptidase